MPQLDDISVVSIVGGGWSFSEVDPEKVPGRIIAVNDAAVHLPRWNVALSMDRKWTDGRWPQLLEWRQPAFLRDKNKCDKAEAPWQHWFKCDETSVIFGSHQGELNGPNSGSVAMNLAHLWRPKTLLLFGFDMQPGPKGQAHWYPQYEWRGSKGTSKRAFADWVGGMRAVRWQFDRSSTRVINVSSRSKIDVFEKVTPRALGIGR